jgi:hypothetical protein
VLDRELQLVYNELKRIKKTISSCEGRVLSLETEIRIKFEQVLEERDMLRNRLDPYSYDCNSLADWDEI